MTSAFGKAILLGEHAVVYGYPALAGAIDCQVHAAFVPRRRTAGGVHLRAPSWKLDVDTSTDHPVAHAVRALLAGLCVHSRRDSATGHTLAELVPDRDIEVHTSLPAGAGLGSSAALAVALTRLLAQVAHEDVETLSANDIADIANRAEEWCRCRARDPRRHG